MLFGEDPTDLRREDLDRYLELSRIATGEAMAGAMSEWRRQGSECRGALVWTLRDLVSGAGWGLIDARGRPKAAYYFLKRVLQPVALLVTDEGLNGLALHALNDGSRAIECRLRLVLYQLGETPVADESVDLTVPARGVVTLSDAAVLGRFVDTTYAYRFGPQGHDVVVATLMGRESTCLGRAFHFPRGLNARYGQDPVIEATAARCAADAWRVTIRARRFAQALAIDAPGFASDDAFFHIEPGGERVVTLRGPAGETPAARVKPANAPFATRVRVEPVASEPPVVPRLTDDTGATRHPPRGG
jgi:beta-mannosidase